MIDDINFVCTCGNTFTIREDRDCINRARSICSVCDSEVTEIESSFNRRRENIRVRPIRRVRTQVEENMLIEIMHETDRRNFEAIMQVIESDMHQKNLLKKKNVRKRWKNIFNKKTLAKYYY